MAKLSDEEAAQLKALTDKQSAPDEPDDDGPGDDGHVIVLRGGRADSFLAELLGPAPKRTTPKKSAPTGKTAKPGAPDPGDDDPGDDDPGDPDPAPPEGHRFFRK